MKVKQKQLNKNKISNEGYTLIEVVIVLLLTSVVFVSIYALFAKSMKSDAESRYEIVAAALAQEGIEMIKNKREKNEMDWAMWNSDDDPTGPPGSFVGINDLSGCNPELDLSNPSLYGFNCITNKSMQYNKSATSGKYEIGCSGNDCVGPVFERGCTTTGVDLDSDDENDSLRVSCVIEWDSLLLRGGKRQVETEIVLTDWQR